LAYSFKITWRLLKGVRKGWIRKIILNWNWDPFHFFPKPKKRKEERLRNFNFPIYFGFFQTGFGGIGNWGILLIGGLGLKFGIFDNWEFLALF